jgi:hypothetical protein
VHSQGGSLKIYVINPERSLAVIQDLVQPQEDRCAVKKLSRDTSLRKGAGDSVQGAGKTVSNITLSSDICLTIAWERFLRHV